MSFEGSVEGTATYDRVDVQTRPDEELFELTCHYDDTSSVYKAPNVEIGGMRLSNTVESAFTLTPSSEDSCVWIIAEGEVLSLIDDSLTDETPPELD